MSGQKGGNAHLHSSLTHSIALNMKSQTCLLYTERLFLRANGKHVHNLQIVKGNAILW